MSAASLLARYGAPGSPHKALPKVSQEMLAEMVVDRVQSLRESGALDFQLVCLCRRKAGKSRDFDGKSSKPLVWQASLT
jgi:hypothetical protein